MKSLPLALALLAALCLTACHGDPPVRTVLPDPVEDGGTACTPQVVYVYITAEPEETVLLECPPETICPAQTVCPTPAEPTVCPEQVVCPEPVVCPPVDPVDPPDAGPTGPGSNPSGPGSNGEAKGCEKGKAKGNPHCN